MKTNLLLLLLVAAIVILQVRQFRTAKSMLQNEEGKKPSSIQQKPLPPEADIIPPPMVLSPYNGNSTFAACLLVSDDNHWLIEWLAYHFLKLPLRYLVVSSDPRARTKPDAILQRYQHNMTITQWSDEHFLPKHWRNRMISNSKGLLMKHRERQRHFYPACFEYLKKMDRTWVAVVDVDEFVTAEHPYYYDDGNPKQSTVLKTIQQSPLHRNAPCITIPRLRFGTYVDSSSTQRSFVPSELSPHFHDSDFLTLQWKWRGPLNARKVNKLPKSILDVSRIDSFDRQDTDAHRPSRAHCPRRNLYTQVVDSPLVIHHYVGSQDQFQFRNDARHDMDTRSEAKLQEYGRIKGGMEEYICDWVQEFVEKYGVEEAKRLLEGVGDVSFTAVN